MSSNDPSSPTAPSQGTEADIITPPNKLKEAVGSGGLDMGVLHKAQSAMDTTAASVDFKPQALPILHTLKHAYESARSGHTSGPAAIEAMIHPAMQLKAQGGMFKYALITEVCNTLVNFLETVERIDTDMLDIVDAHAKAINLIVTNEMNGDGGAKGRELRDALLGACNRYYRRRLG